MKSEIKQLHSLYILKIRLGSLIILIIMMAICIFKGELVVDLHRKLRQRRLNNKALEFKSNLFSLISHFEKELLWEFYYKLFVFYLCSFNYV